MLRCGVAKLELREVVALLPNLQECPLHPDWIVLPFHGLRACCLWAALDAIAQGAEDPQGIAAAAIATEHVIPLRRRAPKPDQR